MSSPFAHVQQLPRDPVLGITEAFVADSSPRKVNLGVGVYLDENGHVPLLDCVQQAEEELLRRKGPHSYVPIDGIAAFDNAVASLIFSGERPSLDERLVTVQALGGTGALKLGADFLRTTNPSARIWISDPSWENHRALFSAAGFEVETYPYYRADGGLDFAGLIQTLSSLPSGDILLLHACCHNPTGLDLEPYQWAEIQALAAERGVIPFLDAAYLGFADGLDADRVAIDTFAQAGLPFLVSFSFSKSLSLYGERVGALAVVTGGAAERGPVLSQIKRIARTTYSSPPSHGGATVATILNEPGLTALWHDELALMRDRIKAMREGLAERLRVQVPDRDFSFITRQRGMFSYSGLSKEAVEMLRSRFSIYALDSGRICVAALNKANLDIVAEAIATVLRESGEQSLVA
ncbi:aromatic amino acid transaminase [Beijerinckia indica]|uniref:Aminotransferase n=1 Tax=Beijerinckia indica subsp. indica (strain ATCC 9039 / DSM 1715 / NCIMB 8712) TaxID=395963 RepID=B2IG81_BEII9|nr:amino acid aminotransferase [Beijerinckia indica]ACB97155.1 Aspartate transaminase [Beijerinckia indica subsp. indica ATCC 9039]